jgi:Family of unknown function (DUF6282)
MKHLLFGLSALALSLLAVHAAAQVENGAAIGWSTPLSSMVIPSRNIAKSAWEGDATRTRTPSVDQHLSDPILEGAIDLHAHFGPDSYHRQWDAFEIARLAQERGMRGLVLKNHWSESAGLAYLVRKYAAPGLEVYGGLVLNAPEGGINPQAVRYFAEVEGHYAKVVWMPTHDSEHEVRSRGEARPYVRVSSNGTLLPEVLEVLDLIAQYHLTLATGHVSEQEMLMIVREAQARGIDRIIITHPNLGPMYTDATVDQLRQAIAMGAYAEVVASQLRRANRADTIARIRTLGPEHCFVASDSGLIGTPNHADALVLAARELRSAGFSERELDLMFKRNPALLLGLPVQ